ncbi:MAG: tannase/feruloyl esterase family alpha/beta hydrolase [Gammaproteobacteria bacterium]|nr:tannase/feruloyl esterase family alpha/beta hydrolase [Gammaproteobacteria bacterium]
MILSRPLILFGLCLASLGAQAQEAACSALAEWTGGADDLQIAEAAYSTSRTVTGRGGTSEPLPPHCRVAGSFEHRTGIDGRDYAIRFAINMPDDWNGRFLFQGGGGLNGSLREPVGAQAAGTDAALARGFAVVSTDSGHVGSGFDASFMADQQAMLNFQYQANAKVTEVARPIIERYYGSPIDHSFFVGCSTGGREGMIMAQRFPHLFDGIVSGAPAMRTGVSNLALRWVSAELGKATDPRDPFTPEEEGLIMGALMDRCDALDGQADGLIFNRGACDFDPRQLACPATSGPRASGSEAPGSEASGSEPAGPGQACLAADKAEALARALGGPTSSAGLPVYVPFPYDSALDDTGGIPGLLLAGGSPPEGGSGADLQRQNVDAEYMAAMATDESIGNTATQYNVSTFVADGGKHIFYHGEGDAWFSANDTVRYFERMAEANAGVKPVGDYARLYLVPGMGHCAGGEQTVDSFDLLTPLVEWVESGEAPGAVVATGESMPGQSRPLCPWPEYAHFEGGDPARAESYSCRAR